MPLMIRDFTHSPAARLIEINIGFYSRPIYHSYVSLHCIYGIIYYTTGQGAPRSSIMPAVTALRFSFVSATLRYFGNTFATMVTYNYTGAYFITMGIFQIPASNCFKAPLKYINYHKVIKIVLQHTDKRGCFMAYRADNTFHLRVIVIPLFTGACVFTIHALALRHSPSIL